MTDLSHLIGTPLPSSVRVHPEGLPRVIVQNALGLAEVYFQGAHVTTWHPARSRGPVLWMSGMAVFEPGKPIRGGVPVCFPWFGPHPGDAAAPAHGFARVRDWSLVDAQEDARGAVTLVMELAGAAFSHAWPHRFRIRHRITIGTTLRLELEVRNDADEAFTFEEALHSYFAVADIHQTSIEGLEGAEYVDKVAGSSRDRQGNEPVRFAGETDRVFVDTRATCRIHDHSGKRRIAIAKTGSDATVVWNPWIRKSRAMADFGDDEWPGMVCVETCNVGESARRLAPGESHRMTATIEVQDLEP
jgi:glucose-6-phosphate 1-epimerase